MTPVKSPCVKDCQLTKKLQGVKRLARNLNARYLQAKFCMQPLLQTAFRHFFNSGERVISLSTPITTPSVNIQDILNRMVNNYGLGGLVKNRITFSYVRLLSSFFSSPKDESTIIDISLRGNFMFWSMVKRFKSI